MSGNYFCHVCGGLVDLIKLQPSDVRLCECEKRFARLRAENNRLKAELAEQARIVGMGAERELALLAKAERLEKELAEQGEWIAELKKECERFRQEALDSYLDDEESVITKQALEITRLKVELAEAKKDAMCWYMTKQWHHADTIARIEESAKQATKGK